MPFAYERDDSRRRVVIRFKGKFETNDAFSVIQRHHAENVWTYGVLYDLIELEGHPTTAELRQFMTQDVEVPAGESGKRGPVAFLASDPDLYRKACSYKELGRGTVTIDVFRNRDEADRWLVEHTRPLHSPQP